MGIDAAATFLAGSVLAGLGFTVIVITILVINNLLSKYWKPLNWGLMPSYRFVEDTHPPIDKTKEPKLDDKK